MRKHRLFASQARLLTSSNAAVHERRICEPIGCSTMTTGPIDWGAHDPDLVERVLAVMLLKERPRAWRRERARGDSGVDVADVVEGG